MKYQNDLRASVAASLSAGGIDLFEHLPYILQDLWAMGVSPEVVIELIKRHQVLDTCSKVVDLGCGKGAAAITIAKEFGCQVAGIDGMPDFIETAKSKSVEFGISELCSFVCADVRERIEKLKNFDLAVWGSVGSIFGSVEATLKALAGCLKPQGFLIYDDGYIREGREITLPLYIKRTELLKVIASTGFKIWEERKYDAEYIMYTETEMQKPIIQRCQELMQKIPQKKELFRQYITNQEREWREMEEDMECVTFLLQRSR